MCHLHHLISKLWTVAACCQNADCTPSMYIYIYACTYVYIYIHSVTTKVAITVGLRKYNGEKMMTLELETYVNLRSQSLHLEGNFKHTKHRKLTDLQFIISVETIKFGCNKDISFLSK